jgi:two-component system, NarL family, sensor histidine kinase UhpB
MPFSREQIHILVVEDNPGDFILFESCLHETDLKIKMLDHALALNEVAGFRNQKFDIVFLDLTLPDSSGIDSFIRLNTLLPDVPIVVLSGLADEAMALKCIAAGAQDYLFKDDLNVKLLEKSAHHSIERKKNLQKIQEANLQYELIAEITNDIIWTWELETNTVYTSKKSFFSYDPTTISTDLGWWLNRLHPDDSVRVLKAFQPLLDGQQAVFQEEYRFMDADGTYKSVYSRAVLIEKPGASRQIVGAMMDVTERARLQEELLRTQLDIQKQMTEATILGQEREKKEIGKELHDNINQVLASIKLYIDMAVGKVTEHSDILLRCRENLVYAMSEIRKLSHSLIPPSLGDHGLLDAIRELIEDMNTAAAFRTELSIDGFDESLLDESRKLMLFRIVQEQVNNIVKYAAAQNVLIEFRLLESQMMLAIRDNGVGFDTSKKAKGIGIRNMESRISFYSGTLELQSSEGKGTSIIVLLPLPKNARS